MPIIKLFGGFPKRNTPDNFENNSEVFQKAIPPDNFQNNLKIIVQ